MEVNLPVVSEKKITRKSIDVVPFGFKMADYIRWGFLVADETAEVKKDDLFLIKIKPLKLPENTMISSLGVAKHPIVTVLDVTGKETSFQGEKLIDSVLVISSKNGVVEKGDLIGAVKILFIGAGIITRLRSVEIPKVEYGDEKVEFTIKYMEKDKIKSFKAVKSTHGYIRSNLGYTEYFISNENTEVKAGKIAEIKIKPVDLPASTVTVNCGVMENYNGCVIDFSANIRLIEERRVIDRVLFLPAEDGKITKGELLGVAYIYYIATKPPEIDFIEKRITKAAIKYIEDGIREKRMKYIHPKYYRRKETGRWDIIVSDENKEVVKGIPSLIKIRELVLPENSIVTPLYIMRNPMGTLLKVHQPGIYDLRGEKFITHALFLPAVSGEVKKGDLIGVINVYNVEIMTMEKMLSELEYWRERTNFRFKKI
jgi:hypothetical protein